MKEETRMVHISFGELQKSKTSPDEQDTRQVHIHSRNEEE